MDQNTQTNGGLKGALTMGVISLVLVLSTFGLELRSHQFETSIIDKDVFFDSSAQRIDGHRLYRADKNAVVSMANPLNMSELTLTKGRIWLNTIYSGYTTTVKSGLLKITVPPSVSTISYENGKTTIEVLSRFAYVTIGEQRLYIPQNSGVVVYDVTIKNFAKELQQILPSKFFKQFALYTVTKTDSWYRTNLDLDDSVQKKLSKQFIDVIRERGPRVSEDGSSLGQSLVSMTASLKSALTFDADKRLNGEYNESLRYLDTALYNFNIGSVAQGKSMLSTFESKVSSSKAALQDSLIATLDSLAPSAEDPTFNAARAAVQGLISTSATDSLLVGFISLYDATRGAPSPEQKDLVLSSMNILASLIEKNVSALNQKDATYLTELLHDLILSNAALISENSFRSLALLQDQSVSKSTTKEIKTDTQQFFMTQKLDQLTLIKAKLDAGTVDFQQARGALLFIAQTIELVKPLIADSAFFPYFEDQYKTIEPFIGFLRTAETESLHGSYERQFSEYKSKVRDAGYISQLLNTATGGNGLSSVVREELGAVAAQDFASTALTDIRIAFDDGADSSIVIITSSKFDNAVFSARYDTVRKLFTSVVFDGTQVQNGVRLANLRTFLLVSRGKLSLDNNATAETLTEVPVDDHAAKVRAVVEVLKKKLKESQILVDEKYIDSTKYDDGLIRVLLAIRGVEPTQKLFSFEVSTDLSTVQNLEVQTVLGQMPVTDTFLLKELAFRVDQMFERAAFEKTKEAEVKLLLDRSIKTPAK